LFQKPIRYIWIAAIVWTLAISLSVAYHIYLIKAASLTDVSPEPQAAPAKDVFSAAKWNTMPISVSAHIFLWLLVLAGLSLGAGWMMRSRKEYQEQVLRSRFQESAVPLSMILIDLNGTVLAASQASANFFDIPVSLFVGSCVYDCLPEELARKKKYVIDEMIRTAKPALFEYSDEHYHVEVYLEPIMDDHGRVVRLIDFTTDLSAKRRHEEAISLSNECLRQREKENENLLKIARLSLENTSFEETAPYILTLCKSHLGVKDGYIAVLSEAGKEKIFSAEVENTFDPSHSQSIRELHEQVLHSGNAVCKNQLNTRNRNSNASQDRHDLQNAMIVPLKIEGKIVGLMGIAGRETDFTDEDLRIASAYADIAAITFEHSRTVEALSTSELRHRLFSQHFPGAVTRHEVMLDREGKVCDLRLLDASPGITNVTDRKIEDLLAHPVREILPDFDFYWIQAIGEVALTGKSLYFEYLIPSLDRWFYFTCYSPQHGQVNTIMWDITQQKQAQEKLRIRQELLTTMGSVAKVGGWERDVDTGRISFTEEMYKIYELPSDYEVSLENALIYHPEDRVKILAAYRQTAQYGEPCEIDARLTTAKGNHFWVRITFKADVISGKVVKVFGATQDITEQKRVEEELEESRELYRQLFEAESDAIFLTDKEVGNILAANSAASALYGYGNEEFLGMNAADLSAEPDVTRQLIQVTTPPPDHVITIPLRQHRKKDGSQFLVEITARSFTLAGRPVLIAAIRDITERKQREERQLQIEKQLQQMQKLESLNRMAGAIAHNFNNLLGVVLGNLELAMYTKAEGEGLRNKIEKAMTASKRAAEISRLMLVYLGQSMEEKAELDVASLCRETEPLSSSLLPKQVRLKIVLPARGPIVRANAIQLRQTLSNVVTNAGEAMEGMDGIVTLSVGIVPAAAVDLSRSCIPNWQPAKKAYCCVEIADTGSGMDPSNMEQIFDPFFSTRFTGRGLGLAVVLGLVKAHDGTIVVESTLGKGSVFKIFLPIVETAKAASNTEAPAAYEPTEQRGLMLVVDDEPSLRKVAEAMMIELGCAVVTAADGAEALQILRENKDPVTCVLLDLTMPGMDGWETLTTLRAVRPDLTVILTSGFSEAQVMAGKHPAYPHAFLQKPYGLRELEAALTRALGK